jgi:hypothetical protein
MNRSYPLLRIGLCSLAGAVGLFLGLGLVPLTGPYVGGCLVLLALAALA